MPEVFGRKLSKPAVVAIVGGSGLAIWFAWKQHKASAGTSTSASAIDPVTGLPYSQDQQIDPLTGQAYLAEAQEYGSVSAAENAVAGESSIDYSNAANTGTGVVGSSSTVPVSGSGYASNAAWAQAVEAGLTDVGYTSTDIAAALGLYLAGLPLGTAPDGTSYASIVEAAIAEYGSPPVGTYQVILATPNGSTGSGSTGSGTSDDGSGDSGTTTTSTGGTTTTTPPPAPKYAGAISNLQVTGYDETGVSFAWNAATNATGGYSWKLTSVDGQGITKSGDTTATHVSVTGLTKAGIYNFGIQALPGGPGNNIHTPSLKG